MFTISFKKMQKTFKGSHVDTDVVKDLLQRGLQMFHAVARMHH